jgi:hypothetical protein
MAFCNELIAVVVCSLGIGRLYLNQHDPRATSAIGMMLREVASFSMRDHRNVQARRRACNLAASVCGNAPRRATRQHLNVSN